MYKTPVMCVNLKRGPVIDCKMSYYTLLFLAFGILSSFMLSEVSALRLPLPLDSDPNRFTWGQFPEVSALYFLFF